MQRGNEGLRQDTKTKQDHGKEIQSQTWKDSECLSYPKNFPFISLKIFFFWLGEGYFACLYCFGLSFCGMEARGNKEKTVK